MTTLAQSEWLERRAAHETRVRAWTDPHQQRAARGEKQPVDDFLFEYYRFRPSWLKRWHPGPDIVLLGDAARDYLRWPDYQETSAATASAGSTVGASLLATSDIGREQARSYNNIHEASGGDIVPPQNQIGVTLNCASFDPTRRDSLAWILNLLRTTAERPPQFACFGLHEWAMIYRQTPDEIRHNAWPLRFAPDEIARIVEAQPIRCSHFDAFRFFTPPARPLNRLQPERATTALFEQRGCLHANMDLYKWAFKLAPFTPSELIADCFALARDIREIDMRASPYDLQKLGYVPIKIETAEGRTEYEIHQRVFAERSQPLRARLVALCERLIHRAEV